MPVAGKPEKKVSFTFTVEVDMKKEWHQIFEESWRVMKYYFYDENMHGYDWDAIKESYKPLLQYVGNNQDLYDLTNEMIGELNASHTETDVDEVLRVLAAFATDDARPGGAR